MNNATPTIGAAWTVSGLGSMVIVGNGTDATTFTIPSGFAANAVIDVASNATLRMQNATLPSLGNIAAGSTIEYAQATGITIPDRNYSSNLIFSGAGAKNWALGANRTVGGTISVVGTSIFQVGGAQLTVSGNVTVDEGAQIGCSNNSGTIVAAAAGTQTFTLNGLCRVSSNATQAPNPTTGFNRQFAFDAYVIGANSIVSFRNPTATASVSVNIDQPTGVSFANVEFYNIQTAAYTTTFFMRQNIVVTRSVAFPRIVSGQPIVFDMDGKTLTVGGQILNSLGTIGSNVGNTNTSDGTRTYTMSGTLELNGTAAQTTLGGTDLPGTFTNLIINNAAGVTTSNAITVSGTTTITAGSMLSMGATLTTNGAVTVNGTFRLNSSGWATGSGAWNYGSNGTLAFNVAYGVDNNHVYWPATNGPVNVSVATGVLTLNTGTNRTVSGLFQTSHGVAMSGATLTLNGTAQINTGGYFSNAPVYGPASTLRYNTGTTYGRGTEWNSPANVQLSNNTTLNYPNTDGGAFSANLSIPGNLTIDAGSSLFMDWGGGGNKSGRLTVGGNAVIAGNLSLGNAVGGDLYVGGNWTKTTGTFAPNGREVRFTGTTHQSINNAAGETFAWLTIANAPGSVVTLNDHVTVSNNMSIQAGSAASNASGKTLAVGGNFSIGSSASGTGTFKNSGTLTVGGTTTVHQHLTNQSWYLASPLTGTVTPTNLTRIQGFNEGVGSGNDWSVSGTTMQSGKGYIVNVQSAPNTVAFSGSTIRSGNVSIPLTRQGAGNENKNGFNLIGNPYTAYLDWVAVAAANASKMPTSTMWYRTKVSGNWDFTTVNGAGVVTPANASRRIPPMQGFWVRALQVGNSTLDVTDAMVMHDNSTSNRLKAPAAANTELQLIRLQVSNATHTDELVIYTDSAAANTLDWYDAPKMDGDNPDKPEMSSLAGTESLAINAMHTLPLDTDIPLRFVTHKANLFALKMNEATNLPAGITVVLKDNGTEIDISSGNEHFFSSDVTTNANRFSLVFRSPGVVTRVNPEVANQLLVHNIANKQIALRYTENMLNTGKLTIYNAMGQLVQQLHMGNEHTVITVPASGVYLIHLVADGKQMSKRVIVK